jgi:hypothetical protein
LSFVRFLLGNATDATKRKEKEENDGLVSLLTWPPGGQKDDDCFFSHSLYQPGRVGGLGTIFTCSACGLMRKKKKIRCGVYTPFDIDGWHFDAHPL